MERAEEQKERKGRGDDGEENRWSHGDHEPEDTGSITSGWEISGAWQESLICQIRTSSQL